MPLTMRAWPYIAAIVSGLTLALAFPRWNVESVVWLWALPILSAIWLPSGRQKCRPFAFGWLAGMAFFLPNLEWLRHSSRVVPPAFALDHSWVGWPQELMGYGAVFGLSLYCSLYFGLWASFTYRVARPRDGSSFESLRGSFSSAAAWVGCEWVRGYLFTGFGWNGLGVAFHQNIPFIQIADTIGVTGLSFLPIFVSCVVVNSVSRLVWDLKDKKGLRPCYDAVIAAALIALVVGYGFFKIRNSQPGDGSLNVVLLQPHVPQAIKWQGNEDEGIYQQLATLTQAYAVTNPGEPPTDLVVWPESALPAPLFGHREHQTYFDSLLALGDFSILTGTEIQLPNQPMYTSAVLMRGSFENQQHYHKRHLVPFGEYLPFRDIFPFSLLQGVLPGDFTPGPATDPLRLEKPDLGLIPLICFEDTVGRLARKFVRPGPQIIVNVTNDGWFLQSEELEMHSINSLFRAVELGLPMIRSANTGVTCVIDPLGRVTSKLTDPVTGSIQTEGALKAQIRFHREPRRTLYARFGDVFSILMLGMSVLAAIRNRRSFRHQPPRGIQPEDPIEHK